MNAVAKLLDTIAGSYDERLSVIAEIIDASNNSVSVCEAKDLELPIIYANKGFLELSGYTSEEVLGSHCLFLQQDDTDQAETAQLLEAIQTGKRAQATLRNYRKDGSRFYNELHATPIFDEENCSRYVIIVQNDVTDLHLLEGDLQEAVTASLRDSEALSQQILSRIDMLSTAPLRAAYAFSVQERRLLSQLAQPTRSQVLAEELAWSEETLKGTMKQLQATLGLSELRQVQAWALQAYPSTDKTLN